MSSDKREGGYFFVKSSGRLEKMLKMGRTLESGSKEAGADRMGSLRRRPCV
jgi:hypothetical protein